VSDPAYIVTPELTSADLEVLAWDSLVFHLRLCTICQQTEEAEFMCIPGKEHWDHWMEAHKNREAE
jgi:hypothetical protein